MLLSLMYHHINSDKFSNRLEVAEAHLKFISEHYRTIFPEEYSPSFFKLRLCLVFDDAYYDFYHYVFPLLKKYSLKAVLAVPSKFILNTTDLSASKRLGLPHSEMMKDDNYVKHAPFCTWKELNKMFESNHVKIASHGHNHIRLADISDREVEDELVQSKMIIEEKRSKKCDTFVFPYSSYNRDLIKKVSNHYEFSFGSGSIMNYKLRYGFSNRTSADELSDGKEFFTFRKMLGRYKGAITYDFIKREIKC
jgi:peptidoglycan/xylan/chitin deacetylase (PgdA/CDA1 family)